jgi:GDPmannose 4,6-dehydratase
MWRILQHSKPDDFVLATGKTTEVREFVRMAFQVLGIGIEFKGQGVSEEGFIAQVDVVRYPFLKIGQKVVAVDERYFRPTEVDLLIGEATKAKSELGWEPSIGLNELVAEMINSDYLIAKSNSNRLSST